MIHRTREGIYNFIKTKGLYIEINAYTHETLKIAAKRVKVIEDADLVYVMANSAEEGDSPLYILYLYDYGSQWACSKKEFRNSSII